MHFCNKSQRAAARFAVCLKPAKVMTEMWMIYFTLCGKAGDGVSVRWVARRRLPFLDVLCMAIVVDMDMAMYGDMISALSIHIWQTPFLPITRSWGWLIISRWRHCYLYLHPLLLLVDILFDKKLIAAAFLLCGSYWVDESVFGGD